MNTIPNATNGDQRHAALCRTRSVRAAFTLIELMVVIAIIAILATVGLLVANRVTEGGRETQTKQIIRLLDQTLDNYAADRSASKFPYSFTDDRKLEFPIIDARLNSSASIRSSRPEPTLQLFLLATKEAPSVMSTFGAIEGKYKIPQYDATQDEWNPIPSKIMALTPSPSPAQECKKEDQEPIGASSGIIRDELVYSSGIDELPRFRNPNSPPPLFLPYRAPQIRDPWGNPIRLVHPRFQGGFGNVFVSSPGGTFASRARDALDISTSEQGRPQVRSFRRSIRPVDPATPNTIGDADEGLCAGGRPYFYSSGPDKDPGKRKDNVYLEPPQFPEETRKDTE